jgi:GTP cyclohydrolase I
MQIEAFDQIEKHLTDYYNGWEGSKQFEGTASRLKRMYAEMCWPSKRIEEELAKAFKAVYPHDYDEMLIHGPTSVWTLCPHHLVPCNFEVHIGYVPNGGVLGLSKFSRIAVALGKRPVMQEQYSKEVARVITEGLKPRGVGVYIVGTHGCMGCRGVLQDVRVKTSVVTGVFDTESKTREEFYDIVLGNRG